MSKESVFHKDYLTCVYGRRNEKRKCYVIFGKYPTTSSTKRDTFFLRLCKNADERDVTEEYNFTADQFCGIEVGCPEPSTRSNIGRFFLRKKKYAFLKVILRDHTVVFRIQWDSEIPFITFRSLEEWRKKLMKELAYKCNWTVYVPSNSLLGEGYGKLHLTDLRLTLTSADSIPECLASWRLLDAKHCSYADDELSLEFEGTANQLKFLTEQAREISSNLEKYLPNFSNDDIYSLPRKPDPNTKGKSNAIFFRKRQSVRKKDDRVTRNRSSSELFDSVPPSPVLGPPCYNCLVHRDQEDLHKPCNCGYKDEVPVECVCALKPNSPLSHSQTLLPLKVIQDEHKPTSPGMMDQTKRINTIENQYEDPIPYRPGNLDTGTDTPAHYNEIPGNLVRPKENICRRDVNRPPKSLPSEDPIHEYAPVIIKLAHEALKKKGNQIERPDDIHENKLRLQIPDMCLNERRLPDIPKKDEVPSPISLLEQLPKVPPRPHRSPNPVHPTAKPPSPPLQSPMNKKPVPAPRQYKPSDSPSASLAPVSPCTPVPSPRCEKPYVSIEDAQKNGHLNVMPTPKHRKRLAHQRSYSWDSMMALKSMGGGRLVDQNPIATLPRNMQEAFLNFNENTFKDMESPKFESLDIDATTDEVYDLNKLLESFNSTTCTNRQSIQWYMNAVCLSDNDDRPPPIPSRDNRMPLYMEPEYESARSVHSTLKMVLERKPPLPDTLQLSSKTRNKVCLQLYLGNVALHDWKVLASAIGLEFAAVELISSFQVHHQNHTAAEIVLRHWQYIYNTYKDNREKCPYECTCEKFKEILNNMNRLDIIEMIENNSHRNRSR